MVRAGKIIPTTGTNIAGRYEAVIRVFG